MLDRSKYEYIGNYANGFAVVKRDSKYGFVNENGDEICRIQYSEVTNFSTKGTALVKFSTSPWIVMNNKGEHVGFWNWQMGYEWFSL